MIFFLKKNQLIKFRAEFGVMKRRSKLMHPIGRVCAIVDLVVEGGKHPLWDVDKPLLPTAAVE